MSKEISGKTSEKCPQKKFRTHQRTPLVALVPTMPLSSPLLVEFYYFSVLSVTSEVHNIKAPTKRETTTQPLSFRLRKRNVVSPDKDA
jgi:hypothetical protein